MADTPDPGAPAPEPTRGFSRGIMLTLSSTGVTVVALFAESIIAARVLSTDAYGVYVLLLALVNFFVTVVDLGYKSAVTQMIASSDRERQAVLTNTALVSRVAVVVALAVILWLAGDALVVFDPSRGLLQYALYIPAMLAVASFDELLLSILQGFRIFKHLAAAQIIRSVARVVFTAVFLLVFNMGVLALIYSWILSYAVAILYEFLMVPVPRRIAWKRPELKELLRFGAPLQATRLLWFLFNRIDILLLGTMAGPAAVAYYGVANRIPDALVRLSDSYTAVYFPTLSSLLAGRRTAQASWFVNHSLRLVSFLTALAALVCVLFSREIVTLLFSEKYLVSAPGFALLMIGFHMMFLVNLMGFTLTAARRAGMSLATNVLRTAVHIAADLVLIPLFGFMGPTIAELISTYTNTPANVFLLRRVGIKMISSPFVIQTALLLGGAGLFAWLRPEGLLLKLLFVALFAGLNVLLSTVSLDDFSLVLPERLFRRRAVLPPEGMAEGVAEGAARS